ncbi:ABC transporter permease [Aeromicrobium sp. CTD01-1L150]|uniref:ABC transporter permease n=1 Tax=Aeromicrobium sp. CTD01-1L150 TaxID=3341830 RepID=UPI0035C0A9A4
MTTPLATRATSVGRRNWLLRRHLDGVDPLLRFVLARMGQALVMLALLLPAVFLLFRLAPGDPADAVVGPDVDPAIADRLREDYGLDEPLWRQFLIWISGVFRGDLGQSFQYQAPVSELVGERLLNTLALVLPACLLAVTAGIVIGAFAGAARPSVDRAVMYGAYAIKSSPAFWVGTLAVILFSYRLGWFPSIGTGTTGSGVTQFFSLSFLHHMILPMLILAMFIMVEPLLTTRSGMKEVAHSDFIVLARAQGVSNRSIVLTHGVRNSLLPVVSLAPLMIEALIGGQIIMETIFSWPGMGRAIVAAVANADYPMMQAVFLITAGAVIVTNMCVDIAYAYLDPRVRIS